MWYRNIEDVENLPFKESRKMYLTRKYTDMYNLGKFDHPWYRSDSSKYPWNIANRVAKHFIGQSFDKAFSHYCKLVPKYEQGEFLDLFELGKRGWRNTTFSLDENKCIVYTPPKRYKRKYSNVFTSIDYEEGWMHKISGKIITEDEYSRLLFGRSNYQQIVLSGYWKEFESYYDKEFVRLRKEKEQQKKLLDKRYKKYLREKEYCFKTWDELNNTA